jgi:hypothetical protein
MESSFTSSSFAAALRFVDAYQDHYELILVYLCQQKTSNQVWPAMGVAYVIAFVFFLMSCLVDPRYGFGLALYIYIIVVLESLHSKFKEEEESTGLIQNDSSVFSIDVRNQNASAAPPSYDEVIAQRF